jgi:FkbM family methyltransferase
MGNLLIRLPSPRKADASLPTHLNILDARETGLQRKLADRGLAGYEAANMAAILMCMELSAKPRVFYDVGAHIGLYSAVVASLFPRASIFAFEPTPATLAVTRSIRDINQLNSTIVEKAVSDQPGTAQFFLSNTAETSNSLNAGFRPGSPSIAVEVTTLDEFVAAGAPPPNVIKIDVETLEPAVLAGAKHTIETHRPWISCEFLAKGDGAAVDQIVSRLAELDYHFYQLFAGKKLVETRYADLSGKRKFKSTGREWLIAPRSIGPATRERYSRWAAELAECTRQESKRYTLFGLRKGPYSTLSRVRRRVRGLLRRLRP